MGRLLNVTAILVIATSTLHCAKNRSYGAKAAPSSTNELGLIVQTTPAQLDSLVDNNPQVTVRALSANRGIFELSNISVSAAQSISSTPVVKNEFFQGIKKSKAQKLSLSHLAKNTSPDAVAALQTCFPSPTAPSMQVDISYNPTTLTIELGEEVTISAIGASNLGAPTTPEATPEVTPQTPAPAAPVAPEGDLDKLQFAGKERDDTAAPAADATADKKEDVRILWDIRPPGFSEQAFATGIGASQKFTPDSVGLYQIAVVAQDKDLSCSVTVVPLLVTSNPELTTTVPALTHPEDLSLFTHLGYVHAKEAWEKATGKDIVIAVLDSGVNYNHMGIRQNIATKTNEAIDGNDDDGNGLADDNVGWDFISNDRFPFDDDGHGSHVAGLVASPVLGVAPEAKILPVKVLNAAGSSDMGTVIAGIYYAVDSGARIINASLGFDNASAVPAPLLEAVEYARSKNVIFLAAAGNGDDTGLGFDIKTRPTYPASFGLDNMIAVGATALNEITSYSNFNNELVHVAAPGGNEKEFVVSLSTTNPANSPLAGQAGTSMACPVTAGVVALMLSADKTNMPPKQIRQILMDTGDELPSLLGKTVSGRQVNAQSALKAVLDLQPAAIQL